MPKFSVYSFFLLDNIFYIVTFSKVSPEFNVAIDQNLKLAVEKLSLRWVYRKFRDYYWVRGEKNDGDSPNTTNVAIEKNLELPCEIFSSEYIENVETTLEFVAKKMMVIVKTLLTWLLKRTQSCLVRYSHMSI